MHCLPHDNIALSDQHHVSFLRVGTGGSARKHHRRATAAADARAAAAGRFQEILRDILYVSALEGLQEKNL